MNWHNLFDPFFILATVGGTIVKLLTSPYGSLLRALLTAFVAIFSAIIFTDPILKLINLDPNFYRNAMAAVVAMTGEGVARWIINLSSDPPKLLEFLAKWRGGGK